MKTALAISNWLTASALPIALGRRDEAGAPRERTHCTGFLWQHGDDLYLITNWHCVTGWHPIEGRALDDMGFEPEFVVVPIWLQKETDREVGGQKVYERVDTYTPVELRQGDRPAWLEHPRFRRRVDVVAIKCGPVAGTELMSTPINRHQFQDMAVGVGDEAFVIGFPMKMEGGHGFPIWKRASLATEPDFDLDGLPKLLIDTATRQGMSGSPVVAVQRGFWKKRDGGMQAGDGQSFLGVYSSRIGDDPLGVQLGTVWKASVVDEIIDGAVEGRGPHDPD